MPILTAADQAAYFPEVTQTGNALDVLCAIAQAYCEGAHGANRPLSFTEFTEVSPVWDSREAIARLSMHPVSTILEVQARGHVESFGRLVYTDWSTLDPEAYQFEAVTNEIRLRSLFSQVWSQVSPESMRSRHSETKVRYSAGFDFNSTDSEAIKIKAIAGAILTYFANRYYGQLESNLENPTGTNVTSINITRIDTYLKAALLPLKQYSPRVSSGMVKAQSVPILIGGAGS